jgi:hypothetical protein
MGDGLTPAPIGPDRAAFGSWVDSDTVARHPALVGFASTGAASTLLARSAREMLGGVS